MVKRVIWQTTSFVMNRKLLFYYSSEKPSELDRKTLDFLCYAIEDHHDNWNFYKFGCCFSLREIRAADWKHVLTTSNWDTTTEA